MPSSKPWMRPRRRANINLKPTIKRMSKEKLLGLFRHLLTFGGGVAVAKGWLSAEQMTAIVGAVVTVIGAFMSVKAPEKN